MPLKEIQEIIKVFKNILDANPHKQNESDEGKQSGIRHCSCGCQWL